MPSCLEPRVARVFMPTESSGQLHLNPDTYLDEIRTDVGHYDALQDASIDAIPRAPTRVLELGVGTGETTRRLLERYPEAQVTGLDSTPEMVFHAKRLGIDARLARMEDPLPDGPWDLVISVLSVHHLDDDAKRDLFRRVRETSRALVLGDVVRTGEQTVSLEDGVDFPAAAAEQAEWSGGEVTWQKDDLAVIRAVYD